MTVFVCELSPLPLSKHTKFELSKSSVSDRFQRGRSAHLLNVAFDFFVRRVAVGLENTLKIKG